MNKVAVIYRSKYGVTKRYAQHIAAALDADIFNATDVSLPRLKEYDAIVYGGSIYAGHILSASLVARFPKKPLAIFTVGLADPAAVNFKPILMKNLPPDKMKSAKFFHLRGSLDLDKLNFFHRRVIKMMKKGLAKRDAAQLNSEQAAIAQADDKVDFYDEASAAPIIEYIKQLSSN